MAGSGGSSTQTTASNQQRDPWGPAQPHLRSIMQDARMLYETGNPVVAGMDWRSARGINDATALAQGPNYGLSQLQGNQASLNSLRDRAAGQTFAEQYVPGIMGRINAPTAADTYLTDVASGATAGNNPHLAALLDANASRIGNRVNSAVSGAGRYGSFAHGDALARTINETNLPLLAQSYENDRARQLQATGMIDSARQSQAGLGLQGAGLLDSSRGAADTRAMSANQLGIGLAPMVESMRYAPSQMLMSLGDRLQAQQQREMDSPWTNLARYSGSVTGLSGLLQGMGTSQGTETREREDTASWNDLLKFGSNVGAFGLGLLSDSNEKTDIKKLGKDPDTGLTMYAYRYKDDPKHYPKVVGPMAQEIAEKFPGSTGMLGGKMFVKPEAAGLLG